MYMCVKLTLEHLNLALTPHPIRILYLYSNYHVKDVRYFRR